MRIRRKKEIKICLYCGDPFHPSRWGDRASSCCSLSCGHKHLAGSPEMRFWSNVDTSGDCWEWTGPVLPKDYPPFWGTRAHRFSWELHNKTIIPDGLFVLHSCDNKKCVRPAHLFLGTQNDNVQDAVRKGRMRHGVDHFNAKLTDDDVRVIRALVGSGVPPSEVARGFGIVCSAVSSIIKGRRWKHVL